MNTKQARAKHRRARAAALNGLEGPERAARLATVPSFRSYARWLCAGVNVQPTGKLARICQVNVGGVRL